MKSSADNLDYVALPPERGVSRRYAAFHMCTMLPWFILP